MSFFQAVTTVDFAVLDFIQEHLRCAFLDVLMPFFSYIAEGGAVWIIAAVVMLFFRKTRKWGLLVLVAMAAGFIIGEICLKNIICRVRPCYFTDIAMLVNKPNSYSFPSGHSCSSFAAATIIFFMNKKVGAAAIVLAFLVAFSRMYVYVHYPTDVLCGILLGVLCAVVTYSIYKKFIEKKNPKTLPKVVVNMKKHRFLGSARSDVFCIRGIDLFRYKWYSGGECASVTNPENGRLYSFSAYFINYGDKKIEFIAGKDEENNWLFFEN